MDFLGSLGAIGSTRDVSRPKIGKCTATLKTGQIIETKSAQEVQKLASKAPDGVVMCEAAQHPYESFLRCQGRVAEKRGWLFLCGTFEGSEGWYAEYFNEWTQAALNDPLRDPDEGVAYSLASWDNTIVYPGGREDPEIKRLERAYSRVPGMFEERCAAIPIPPVGLVFREVRRSVHFSDRATFDPKLPVYLAVDPSDGSAPYAVGAYQFRDCECPYHYADGKTPDTSTHEGKRQAELGGPGLARHHEDRIEQAFCIDEVYEQEKQCEEIIDICRSRPWWKNVRGGAIDVEAPDEQKRWKAYGRIWLVADKIPQLHGIRRLKSFLFYEKDARGHITTPPHLIFNPKCQGIAFEFTKYKRKNPTDADMIPAEVPPNNQPNHHIKASWYLLVARYGFVKGRKLPDVVSSWKRQTGAIVRKAKERAAGIDPRQVPH